jgi:LacI family transcriptional regulator, galactose operon repressor
VSSKRVTLADVARKAGVSQTAASFVLSGRKDMRISAHAEERVLRAAAETGYRPNIVSQSLRTGTTHTIGFVSDSVATTRFAGDFIKGALEAARARGNLLLIAETGGDPDLERQSLETMIDRQVDGIVLASMYTRKVPVPKAFATTPAVLLNALPDRPSNVSSVVPNEQEAGRNAAHVLLHAGHRDGIYLIGGGPRSKQVPKGALAATERYQGIKSAFVSAGAIIAGAVECSEWEPEDGYHALRRVLDEKSPPKALICFNDRLAMGVYQGLQEAGLRIPDDVSVVSFDDDPLATWVRPTLTTVALPHYELGQTALNVLFGADERPEVRAAAEVHRLTMPLRRRDSVRSVSSA